MAIYARTKDFSASMKNLHRLAVLLNAVAAELRMRRITESRLSKLSASICKEIIVIGVLALLSVIMYASRYLVSDVTGTFALLAGTLMLVLCGSRVFLLTRMLGVAHALDRELSDILSIEGYSRTFRVLGRAARSTLRSLDLLRGVDASNSYVLAEPCHSQVPENYIEAVNHVSRFAAIILKYEEARAYHMHATGDIDAMDDERIIMAHVVAELMTSRVGLTLRSNVISAKVLDERVSEARESDTELMRRFGQLPSMLCDFDIADFSRSFDGRPMSVNLTGLNADADIAAAMHASGSGDAEARVAQITVLSNALIRLGAIGAALANDRTSYSIRIGGSSEIRTKRYLSAFTLSSSEGELSERVALAVRYAQPMVTAEALRQSYIDRIWDWRYGAPLFVFYGLMFLLMVNVEYGNTHAYPELTSPMQGASFVFTVAAAVLWSASQVVLYIRHGIRGVSLNGSTGMVALVATLAGTRARLRSQKK